MSIAGKGDVNCEQAEQIGQNIQKGLHGLAIFNASIKRKDMIILNRTRNIDSKVMPDRMIAAAAEREETFEQFSQFELISEPS